MRQPDHRPRQRRQRLEQRRGLLGGQRPFRTNRLELWQIDAARRIVLEMAPLHRGPKHRAQHVVNVIDRLGRVPCLREMGHVRLNLLPRDLGKRLVAEPRQQVLLRMSRRCFCVECLYIGNTWPAIRSLTCGT